MNHNKGYKNIIFDLGGVLMNLDYSLTTKAFQQIAPAFDSFDPVYSGNLHKTLFEDFEKGLINAAGFRLGIRKILKQEVSDDAIDNAWNAMLLDLPGERIRL